MVICYFITVKQRKHELYILNKELRKKITIDLHCKKQVFINL